MADFKSAEFSTQALPTTIGNASILHSYAPDIFDQMRAIDDAKAVQAAVAREKRDKEIEANFKYDTPEAIWMPYTQERTEYVNEYINTMADLKRRAESGEAIDQTHPDYVKAQMMGYQLKQDKVKADDIKGAYEGLYKKEMPNTDMAAFRSDISDIALKQGAVRGENDVVGSMEQLAGDPKYFVPGKVVEDFVAKIPEVADSFIATKKQAVGGDQGVYFNTENEISKFYAKDERTGRVKMENGKPVMYITPETKEMLYASEPRMRGYVQLQLSKPENKGKTDDDIVTEMLAPYAKIEKKQTNSGIYKPDKPNEWSSGGGNGTTDGHSLFIKTVAGLQQQTKDIVSQMPESHYITPSGASYLDATNMFSTYHTGMDAAGKPSTPHAVLIDPKKPGVITVIQNNGDKPVEISGAGITNFINGVASIKANNMSYENIRKEGARLGTWGQNNDFLGYRVAQGDVEYSQEEGELADHTAESRGAAITTFDEIMSKKSGGVDYIGESTTYQNNVNNSVLKGNKLNLDGDLVSNPNVVVTTDLIDNPFNPSPKFTIKDGDKVIKAGMTEAEFKQAIGTGLIVPRNRAKYTESKGKAKATPAKQAATQKKQIGGF